MKQIIFLEPWPTVMIYKIARLFKKRGYNTISIRILENKGVNNKFFKQAFDEIISFNLSFFKLNIKNIPSISISILKQIKHIFKAISSLIKLRPYVIFARANPNWPCALTKILFKKIPLIYFPYDIRSGEYATRQIAKEMRKLRNFEINAEKFCLEKADGIMHKGDPNELKYLNGRIFKNLKVNPVQISFPPYCSKDFNVPINKNKLSKKDKEIHLVHVGSMGNITKNYTSFLFDYFREIVRQKLHVHVYTKSNTLSNKELMEVLKNANKEIFNSKYFHPHFALEPDKLIKEISKYDYGLWFMSTSTRNLKGCISQRLQAGNKISSYLEAGLPFFYPPEFEFIDKLMKKYELQLHVQEVKNISNLKERIKKLNYKKLEKNVIKARQDLSLEKNFPKLEKFVKEVVEIKKNQEKYNY